MANSKIMGNQATQPPTQSTLRGQTAVEYLLLIGAAIVFVTIIAYIVKSAVGGAQ